MSSYLYGLDLSLKDTGITIYDLEKKEFVYIGHFNTEKIYATKQYKGLYLNGIKLKKLGDWILELIEKYPPREIAIERGYSRFKNETQTIFRTHGLANYLFWDVPQTYYPPKKIKATVYHGNANKEEVEYAIKANFPDIKFENDNESDSFAVCLTHLIENNLITFNKPTKINKKPKNQK